MEEKHIHQVLADSCTRLVLTSLKQETYSIDAPRTLVAGIKRSRVELSLPLKQNFTGLVHRPGIETIRALYAH